MPEPDQVADLVQQGLPGIAAVGAEGRTDRAESRNVGIDRDHGSGAVKAAGRSASDRRAPGIAVLVSRSAGAFVEDEIGSGRDDGAADCAARKRKRDIGDGRPQGEARLQCGFFRSGPIRGRIERVGDDASRSSGCRAAPLVGPGRGAVGGRVVVVPGPEAGRCDLVRRRQTVEVCDLGRGAGRRGGREGRPDGIASAPTRARIECRGAPCLIMAQPRMAA